MRIDLILLAAGNSRRFGSNKLLYSWQGRPLYRYMLEGMLEAAERCASGRGDIKMRVTVVTQYREILEDAEECGCLGIFSPESVRGMAWSIRAALSGMEEEPPDYFAFFMADMPCLTGERIEAFLRGFFASGRSIGCGQCGEVCGNPAIFSWEYVDEFRKLSGDQGGKRILKGHLEDCFFFEMTEEEWRDVDWREEAL